MPELIEPTKQQVNALQEALDNAFTLSEYEEDTGISPILKTSKGRFLYAGIPGPRYGGDYSDHMLFLGQTHAEVFASRFWLSKRNLGCSALLSYAKYTKELTFESFTENTAAKCPLAPEIHWLTNWVNAANSSPNTARNKLGITDQDVALGALGFLENYKKTIEQAMQFAGHIDAEVVIMSTLKNTMQNTTATIDT